MSRLWGQSVLPFIVQHLERFYVNYSSVSKDSCRFASLMRHFKCLLKWSSLVGIHLHIRHYVNTFQLSPKNPLRQDSELTLQPLHIDCAFLPGLSVKIARMFFIISVLDRTVYSFDHSG